MHSKNCVHVDVKPTNIFIDTEGNAFLGDFGSATALGASLFGKGTPEYQPPELNSRATPQLDFACLATTLAEKANLLPSPPGQPSLKQLGDITASAVGKFGLFLQGLVKLAAASLVQQGDQKEETIIPPTPIKAKLTMLHQKMKQRATRSQR